MGESQQQAPKPETYQRLIDRLGLALDVARTSARLRDEMPAELELRGLSRAELEVIRAWLEAAPARGQMVSAVVPPEEAPIPGRVVWLKDKARSATALKSRTLQFK
ncbi:hypothetical protein V0R50_03130 [Pseudomonas sp. 148P]|uniref:Uncharacterized protein n=1 Tax=Pseudomonas ulcerans TaxID=3115852 RepID=A0ABU7HL20_9PSED|nr:MULTISPECIES: hypothetical protein [unclassified Pseudomonas]MEE1920896.1 hypothetical protein [Pseudomonas sp. 147P]MEE1932203.1 hypothetical protein [Pseudomonas sp. 148P]